MSIWTRPLFERDVPARRATPVEVRCARLRTRLSITRIGWVLAFQTSAPLLLMVGSAWGRAARRNLSMPEWWELGRSYISIGVLLPVMLVWSVWVFPWMSRRSFDRKAAVMTGADVARLRKSHRGIWFMAAVFIVLVCTLFARRNGVAGLGTGFLGILVGLMVLGLGLTARRGAKVVCARCDYPMGSWRAAGACCIECGSAWKEPWKARVGEKRVDPRLVVAGSVAIVGGGAAVASALLNP